MSTMLFDRRGSGEPLVLVHGVGSRRQVWAPVLDVLAREHDVVAVDLPGFGASPPDGTVPTIEGQAARLQRCFAELGLARPHVAGHSMGGGIALELARSGAVASATAIAPVGFWTPRERTYARSSLRASRRLLAGMPAGARRALLANRATRTPLYAQIFARPWRLSAEDAIATADAFLGAASTDAALDALGRHVFHDAEELAGVPVTIAWGERDRLLPARQAPRARRVLPWARHVMLQGCGHVPMVDDPEQVAAVLLAGARAPAVAA